MSFSDDSELTELTSDEEDVPLACSSRRPSTQQATAKSRASQIIPHLRPPRTTQYTAKSLYDQLYDNSIDLDPEYQRGVVWSDTKQSNLIDSLFHNYYIPPIIFAVAVAADGSERRTCIDGKQRLTSIQQFIDGHIPHKNSVSNQKTWYTNPPGQSHKVLAAQMKRIFDNKQIVCVEYGDLTDDQEREIFQRVQLGVVLTPAERMQAINGSYPSMIRDLRAKVNSDKGFDGYLEWGHARGRDFQSLAQIAFLIEKDSYTSPIEPTAARLELWLHNSKPVPAKLRESAFAAIDTVIRLVHRPDLCSPFKTTKLSPVEFVMIGYLVHRNRSKLSMTQLSDAIKLLRDDVRANWVDIRFNAKVFKHMADFLKKKLPTMKLKSDGNGDISAALATSKRSPPAPSSSAVDKKTSTLKRKRTVLSGDSEAEEEEKPKRPSPKAKPQRKRTVVETTESEDEGGVIKPAPPKAKTSSKDSMTVKIRKSSTTGSTVSKTATKPKVSLSRNALPLPQIGKPSILPSAANATPMTGTSRTPKLPASSASTSTRSKATPRTLKISTPASTTPTAHSGPNSAPVQPLLRKSLPLSSRSRPSSVPPIEAIDITMQPPPIRVKPEPRYSPPSLSAGPLSAPPTSTAPDRLAPMRAAKAAITTGAAKVEAVTPMGSPSLNFGPPSSFVTRDPRRVLSQGCQSAGMPLPVVEDSSQRDLEFRLNQLLVNVGIQKQQPTPPTSASTLVSHESQILNGKPIPVANGSSSGTPTDMSISPEVRGGMLGSSTLLVTPLLSQRKWHLLPSPQDTFQPLNPSTFSSSGPNVFANSAHQPPAILVKDLGHGSSQPPPFSSTSSAGPPPTSASSSGSFFDDRRGYSERRRMSEHEDRRDSRGPGGYRGRDRSRDRTRGPSRDRSRVWKRSRSRSIERSRERWDRERERERLEERERHRLELLRDEERGRERDRERARDSGRDRVGSWGSYSRASDRNSRGRMS